MRVVQHQEPPIMREIVAVFPGAVLPGVMFCWGDKIFVPRPTVATLPPELIDHEQVHCDRQGSDVEGWWRRYLADRDFRLDEELPAHVAEMRSLCRNHAARWVNMRAMRRHFAAHVAKRLSSPLYGPMIGYLDARKLLTDNLPTELV